MWKDPSILTDTLWLFPGRDDSGGHSNHFHGNFVPQVARQAILRFTNKGDTVLDMFCGGGTTLIEASRLGRKSIGVDLVKHPGWEVPEGCEFIEGDSTKPGTTRMLRSSIDLVILHPPYHNIIKFTDLREDLSNAKDSGYFYMLMQDVIRNALEALKPGGHMVLVIGDKYENGEVEPMGFQCMRMAQHLGFRLKAINVKDIQGNERGKGKNANLWRYRAIKHGFQVFKHEYVMFFQKKLA